MPEGRPQTYLSVPAADLVKSGDSFEAKVKLEIGGAKRFGVTPFAQSTTVSLSSDWADPGFEGGFPPDSREITQSGFTAEWSVPYLRRGIRAHGKAHRLAALTGADKVMTVQFVSTDNPYQTVNRALKYAVMFIGLVFIAYFLFEVIVDVRVHPAQYILIGLAQSIFYLLLLAFAERVGFTCAFLISAGATVAATAGYAGAVFGDRKYILRAGLVFALVYGLLYTLMRMQDFALMVGALASFVAISGTMYLTRNLDWYGSKNVK
jgi:inner membrane protein